MRNTPLAPSQWQLVQYRVADDPGKSATCFPTDQAAYMALCRIGAETGVFQLRMYRGQGWFARHMQEAKWLRLLPEETAPRRRPIFDFLETPLMPILSAIVDGSGPGRIADCLAKIAEDRAQREPATADRDFWLDTARAFGTAAAAIDDAADVAARQAKPPNPCRRPGQCVDGGFGPANCRECNP